MTTVDVTEAPEVEPEVGTRFADLHPIIRNLPGMLDIDKDERKLRKTQAFRDEVWRKGNERFEREEARYKQRCAEADEAMKDRPNRTHKKAPDALERRTEVASFRNRFDELNQRRLQVIAEHADTITAQLLDIEADALRKAADAVAVLDQVAPELLVMRETIRRVNLAANRPVRTGGGRIDAVDLVSVVRSGESVLVPTGGGVQVIELGGGVRMTKRTRSTDDDGTVPETLRHLGDVHETGGRIPVEPDLQLRR